MTKQREDDSETVEQIPIDAGCSHVQGVACFIHKGAAAAGLEENDFRKLWRYLWPNVGPLAKQLGLSDDSAGKAKL